MPYKQRLAALTQADNDFHDFQGGQIHPLQSQPCCKMFHYYPWPGSWRSVSSAHATMFELVDLRGRLKMCADFIVVEDQAWLRESAAEHG